MRLFDQVARATRDIVIEDAGGLRAVPGAGALAAAIRDCPLRYVLDDRVAARCRDLLRTDRAMLTPDNDLLRAPAPAMWLEWREPREGRVGLLVTAGDGGRSGTLAVVWERVGADPDVAQATLEWDLDLAPTRRTGDEGLFAIHPWSHPLADHIGLRIDRPWIDHLFASGTRAGTAAVAAIGRAVLRDAEMLFAFSALLLHRPEVIAAPGRLDRLNARRRRVGRAALLDHLEVSLDLNGVSTPGDGGGAHGRAARLHLVRGHMVQRQSRTFWRRSHLRGTLAGAIATRTVQVR